MDLDTSLLPDVVDPPARSNLFMEVDPQNINDTPASASTSTSYATSNPSVASRPKRNRRLPRRFHDILPEPPLPAVPDSDADDAQCCSESSPQPQPAAPLRQVRLIVWDYLRTAANRFGLWREYPQHPSFDPDCSLTLTELSNSHTTASPTTASQPLPLPNTTTLHRRPSSSNSSPHWPFPNKTIQLFMAWLNNGNTSKSEAEANDLVRNCILSPHFRIDDMSNFNAHRENQRIDRELEGSDLRSVFQESSVDILVPTGSPSAPPQKYSVPGLLHRKLTSVIRDAFNDPLAHLLHYSPFKLFHRTTENGSSHNQRVFNEVYSSDAFIDEYKDVQLHGKLPPDDPHCERERVVAALMFSSDATHLADFGNAKAWPIYVMLGNLSKYVRSEMSAGALHHLAYIPSVSSFWALNYIIHHAKMCICGGIPW